MELRFTLLGHWVIPEVVSYLVASGQASSPWKQRSECLPSSPCDAAGMHTPPGIGALFQRASVCWGALLSVVVPAPCHMLNHLFCLFVLENVAQQLESCLVEHRRPFRAGAAP